MEHQPSTTLERRSRRKRRLRTPALALVLVALVASTFVSTTALAEDTADLGESLGINIPDDVTIHGQKGKWTYFSGYLGRVYGNGTQGFIAIAGDSIEGACTSPPPKALGRMRQRANGTWDVRTAPDGDWRQVFIYKTDLEVFEFFDAMCPLLGEGKPLPQPFATGTIVLRDRAWKIAEPFPEMQLPGRYRNSIKGLVTDADGNHYRVRAVANYRLHDDGEFEFFKDILTVRPLHG